MISAVIAEDEPLALARVKEMLAAHPDVSVVGECATATELRMLVHEKAPTLLLLDISLAGGSAMTALIEMSAAARPVVIFLTAHPEFALDAFALAAADYLLKPFDQQRFDHALDRARRLMTQAQPPVPRREKHREHFIVRRRFEIIFIRTAEIDWIQAEGNYSRLCTPGGSYLIRESLQSVLDALDPMTFIRVHRSAVVNVKRIVKIVSNEEERGPFLVLSSGGKVPLGPSFRAHLEELFGA